MFIPFTILIVILGTVFGTVLLRYLYSSQFVYLSPKAYDNKMREIEAARAEKLEAANTHLEIDEVEELYNTVMNGYRIRREHGKGIGMGVR